MSIQFFQSLEMAEQSCQRHFPMDQIEDSETCLYNERIYTKLTPDVYLLRETALFRCADTLREKLPFSERGSFQRVFETLDRQNCSFGLLRRVFTLFKGHTNFFPGAESSLIDALTTVSPKSRARVLDLSIKLLTGIQDVSLTAKMTALIGTSLRLGHDAHLDLLVPFVALGDDGYLRYDRLNSLLGIDPSQLALVLKGAAALLEGLDGKDGVWDILLELTKFSGKELPLIIDCAPEIRKPSDVKVRHDLVKAIKLLHRDKRTKQDIAHVAAIVCSQSESALKIFRNSPARTLQARIAQLASKLQALETQELGRKLLEELANKSPQDLTKWFEPEE